MIYRFGDCELDTVAFELRRGDEACAVEPRVMELLCFFAANAGRLVTKDELFDTIWAGRIVSDSALSSQIKAARRAIGDDGNKQSFLRTIHGKGFRFVGLQKPKEGLPGGGLSEQDQVIRYCRASDGVRLAYATVGEGPTIIKTANWLNHLEYDWESPVWRHLLREFARDNHLVRYDERGTGLSDRDVDNIAFERCVDDLESIVEATGKERFALFGVSQGALIAIGYAVRHPERVSHLVLYGGYAAGWRVRNDPEEIKKREAMVTLMRHGWGSDNPAFRQIFTSLFLPGGTAEQMKWFNELQRITASPEHAVLHSITAADHDIRPLLPKVKTPTLVLHCADDAVIPFKSGQELAKNIPGARFKALTGANHLILENDPAWPVFMAEVRRFLKT